MFIKSLLKRNVIIIIINKSRDTRKNNTNCKENGMNDISEASTEKFGPNDLYEDI